MKCFLLGLFMGLSMSVGVVAVARADSDSPGPTLPTSVAVKWSLEALQPRVAAGAFPGEEHHSEFVIRAVDGKGQPLAGLAVELPRLWNEKGEVGDKKLKEQAIAMPRVEWTAAGKTALTNARGEVHGRFTSGGYIGHVFLRGPGGTQADIEQVWNDEPDPSEGTDQAFFPGNPVEVRYVMNLKRGEKTLPICGHHLMTPLEAITLTAWRRTGNTDEEGKPELEAESFEWEIKQPGEKASAEEKARWEIVSAWVHMEGLKETAPGVYEGTQTVEPFDDDEHPRPVIDGVEIEEVSTFSAPVEDQDVYVSDGGDGNNDGA